MPSKKPVLEELKGKQPFIERYKQHLDEWARGDRVHEGSVCYMYMALNAGYITTVRLLGRVSSSAVSAVRVNLLDDTMQEISETAAYEADIDDTGTLVNISGPKMKTPRGKFFEIERAIVTDFFDDMNSLVDWSAPASIRESDIDGHI